MPDWKPVLCVDFDGVLHSYSSGWQGLDVVSDPPVPGAMPFLAQAVQVFTVAIHSSRSGFAPGRAAMQEWLSAHLEAELGGERGPAVYAQIRWPRAKPAAFVTLDDRALTFTGDFPTVEVLRAFKPWNKPDA